MIRDAPDVAFRGELATDLVRVCLHTISLALRSFHVRRMLTCFILCCAPGPPVPSAAGVRGIESAGWSL